MISAELQFRCFELLPVRQGALSAETVLRAYQRMLDLGYKTRSLNCRRSGDSLDISVITLNDVLVALPRTWGEHMTTRPSELNVVKKLFDELQRATPVAFPRLRRPLIAPQRPGVYIISDRRGRIVHVGGTTTGRDGLLQRPRNHRYRQASFCLRYLPSLSEGR